MSTPSTATAAFAPHHHQYFSHHQNYPSSVTEYRQQVNSAARAPAHTTAAYATGNTSTSELRRTATANSRQTNQLPPLRSSDSSDMDPSQRKPDWNEFYKNGVPKEVIVIDDDDSPEPQTTTVPLTREERRARAALAVQKVVDAQVGRGSGLPQQAAGSSTQTPYYDHSVSTDRTTSAYNTTAGTSLTSQASNGTYPPAYEDAAVGQKRKRTRGVVAEEAKAAKRREVEQRRSPVYFPPPKPPIKAKDVFVEVIADVSRRTLSTSSPSIEANNLQKHTGAPTKCDDDDGHYVVVPDADLTEKYQIIKLLGQGTFGKVVEAYDRVKRTRCAIKIIRSVQKYRDASRIELRVLSTLKSNDRENRNKCIHLRHCFDFRNHICIVTDLYGQSVFDFLKANNFTPFPNTHIQTFARQLLTSVACKSTPLLRIWSIFSDIYAVLHDLNLIHTDLKPENILLVDNTYQTFTYNRTIPSSSTQTNRSSRHRKVLLNPEIRLIDFGSATFDDEYHSSVVSTRHYRAPEIILNLGWSFPCDIWSIGCILVEFYTGDALFQTHDNLEHLAMMEAVVGQKMDKVLVGQVFEKGRKNSASQ